MQLFKEHLGLLDCGNSKHKKKEQNQEDNMGADGYRNMKREDVIVMDPIYDEFYQDIWSKTAEKNTIIYRDVFRCVPDDTGIYTYCSFYSEYFKSEYFYIISSYC